MEPKKPELLAPAGDRERLEAAVRYGADAVYLAGKSFGMRSAPANFGPEELAQARPFAIATGVSAGPFLAQLVDLAREKCDTIKGTVYPIANRFFGETITVSGLVTGGDLIDQLRGRDLGERLLIPTNMLRAGERVFLDDVSLDDVERELGVPVIPVAQDGYELLDAMCGLATAPPDFKPNLPEDEYYRYNPGTR